MRGVPLGSLERSSSIRREYFSVVVAKDGDINFAALDVFLNESGAVEFLVDVMDTLHQLLHALDEGACVDAGGSVLRNSASR